MELRQLKYFKVLAETLHFGEAAEKLNLSQPPLSRQIMLLEDELGTLLFNRTKRKVALTPSGELLYKESVKLLNHTEQIKEQINNLIRGEYGQIIIGYIGSVMYSILPEILSKFSQTYPNVKVILHEMTNEQQEEALLKGEIDLAFLRTPYYDNHIQIKKVYDESFSLVLPADHSFIKNKSENIKELAKEPFIAFAGSCSKLVTDRILSICNQAGFSPKTTLETSQMNTVLRMVANGFGYSIIPSNVKFGYSLNIVFKEITDYNAKAELFIAFRKNNKNILLKSIVNMMDEMVFEVY